MAIEPISYRGENNYFRDAVLNCMQVLKNFASEHHREIRNYYEEDVINPITPCFAVIVKGSSDDFRASQNLTQVKYTINMKMEVWYLHADLTEETKRNEITYMLWEISDWLKKNITLNGFVPKLGLRVEDVRWVPQQRGSRVLAGGVISLLVPKLYSTTVTS